MKKTAIFSMLIRHNCVGITALLCAVAAANTAVFFGILGGGTRGLSTAADHPVMGGIFAVSFLLLYGIACAPLTERAGRQNYFLYRLRVRPERVFCSHALYIALCFVLLFAVEILSILGLSLLAAVFFPGTYNHQSVMLAFYQSDLLHTVFPMQDWLGWLMLAVWIVSLGICGAALQTRSRCRKLSVPSLVMPVISVIFLILFLSGLSVENYYKKILIQIGILLSILSVIGIWKLGVDENA